MATLLTSSAPRTVRRWPAWLVIASLTFASACESHKQAPAERAIVEIEAVVNDAGTAPAKFIPGELQDVQAGVAELKRAYASRRYGAVLERAPAVLAAAEALGPSAAARERELNRALRDQWATLVHAVPAELAAVAERFDRLEARKPLPRGVTVDDVRAAKGRLRDALALWDRALQEEESGRLPEAVTLAGQIRDMGRSVDALSQSGPAAAPVK
ncbi:MAG: hypothetical protein K0R70_1567 [Steroidobacteraceae bacterium]|jgi:hypothetical protein|nr:hypothetical protein [Steroidobacteraceae bacterium]